MKKTLFYLNLFVLVIIMLACNNENDAATKQNVNELMTKQLTVEKALHDKKIDMPNPYSVEVLVNKDFPLPETFEPTDLVFSEARFIFNEKVEKRMLREEAAIALETMFDEAELDGIYLAGVSAYRSRAVQTSIYNQFVESEGTRANEFSAEPGMSEHETGLAIDVSGSNAKCAVKDCFAATEESLWLEENAPTYGFIIRYPEGKESITGYKYEPWHLRYLGVELAEELHKKDITLEEYYGAIEEIQ